MAWDSGTWAEDADVRRVAEAGRPGLDAGDRPTPRNCTVSSFARARSVGLAGAGEPGAEGERGPSGEGNGERGHEGERDSGAEVAGPRGASVSAGGLWAGLRSGGIGSLILPAPRAWAGPPATSSGRAVGRPARRRRENW